MKEFHFDPNQSYQLDAIRAVTDIFEGQGVKGAGGEFALSDDGMMLTENGFGNALAIDEGQVWRNVRAVQERNGIATKNAGLQGMDFSVEMETGTGKTYVYLRTIYELNRLYGFRKFVVVVPSIAIREGVLKNLHITHGHFQSLYDKASLSFEVYDSKRVSNLRNFALSSAIQVLVLNIDAFAKDENVINKPNDKLSGKSPIAFIQATRPIVIVDEPQNMETDIRKRAIQNLNPLCTLRYSATHTNLYNLVYSLNPVDAYDLGLVKRIEVDSVVGENAMNDAFVKVESVGHSGKNKIVAKLWLDVNTATGVQRKKVTVDTRHHFDLFTLSGEREVYRAVRVEEIDFQNQAVSLSTGQRLAVGETQGGLRDEVQRVMIRKAVEEHLKKEARLAKKGIKVLTLFFIDKVKNYRSYDDAGIPVKGKFAQWFEETYAEEVRKPAYDALQKFGAEEVHDGYFSQDNKGKLKDTGGETQADNDTYALIMRDKERLLDRATPLRFIFSHSALREGWDNPNVFQICTLNETKSDLKKRQEIGRGLRLCVDDSGNRIYDANINRLTVIANECYEDFAAALQQEIEADCGVAFGGRIKNKHERRKVNYRKGFALDPAFLEIWDRIKHRTQYSVAYKTDELIALAGKAVKEMPAVYAPSVRSTRMGVTLSKTDGVGGYLVRESATPVYGSGSVPASESSGGLRASEKSAAETPPLPYGGRDASATLPDVVSYIQDKTELTRRTVFDILRKSGRLRDILVNPQLFMDSAVGAIRKTLYELMIDGIKYEKIDGKVYEMTLFDNTDLEFYLNDFSHEVKNADKTIYENYIPLDSSVENQFAKDCETSENVEFYFKLPAWFKVLTPIGNYNPDWAVIFQGERKIYFVAETKSTGQELRPSETMKVKCGKAHFEKFDEVEYRQVSTVYGLLQI
ncbi:MAG: DEAD/DEAH box helicase family protein [Kiritimatiellaeota bacterium]|nr:DEAD/DEAH box helicase family protein [Kiritimatiellota bacterium]